MELTHRMDHDLRSEMPRLEECLEEVYETEEVYK
jgi:hypothetical protein